MRMLSHCGFDVGPPSATMAQHQNHNGLTFCSQGYSGYWSVGFLFVLFEPLEATICHSQLHPLQVAIIDL